MQPPGWGTSLRFQPPCKAAKRSDPGFTFLSSSTAAASQLGQFLARPDGAPASVGRIAEADMADVPRFLNRCGCCKVFQSVMLTAGWASTAADMAGVPRFLNRCGCFEVFQLLTLTAG